MRILPPHDFVMSTVELRLAISSVIKIIQETKQFYDAATDATGLPEAFREVAKNLPLVKDTLRLVKDSVNDETCTAINPVIKTCERKALSLKKLFEKVAPMEGAKRMERYEKALRTLGKGNRVEDLMREILKELQLLAANRAFANGAKLAELAATIKAAMEKLSEIQPSAPDSVFDAPSFTNIDHHGDGIQNNITSSGDHKIFNNTGGGNQAERMTINQNGTKSEE